MMDLSIKLRDGVHGILKKYGMHDDVQRGMCSLERSMLMTEIVSEVAKSKKSTSNKPL